MAAHVVLYDGVCGLCNRVNDFVLKRDPKGLFRFASLQSPFAREALARHEKEPSDLDTVYVVANRGTPEETLLSKSRAALFVLRTLGGVWSIARLLEIVPRALLDRAYDLVARHRYRVFGRYDACPIPRPEHRQRFIET
jgi:predicted DCC family thiol-disulfide oxidoreductase YuxK